MARLPLQNVPAQRLSVRLGGIQCSISVSWHPSSSSWHAAFELPPGTPASYRRIALDESVVGFQPGLPGDIVCRSQSDREPGPDAWAGSHWLSHETD